jgi:hypothetical protein
MFTIYCGLLSVGDIHVIVLMWSMFLTKLNEFNERLEFLLSRAKLGSGACYVNKLSRIGSLINKYLRVELSRVGSICTPTRR